MRDKEYPLVSMVTLKVCRAFLRDPSREVSILQLSRETGITYSHLYNTVQVLSKQGFLIVEKKGNTSLCRINLEDRTNLLLFGVASDMVRREFVSHNPVLGEALEGFVKNLHEKFGRLVVSVVLFGSWAKGLQRGESDVDTLVILSSASKKQDDFVHAEAGGIEARYGFKARPVIVTQGSFVEMMKKREVNVGKEAVASGVVWFGSHDFWDLVFEGLK